MKKDTENLSKSQLEMKDALSEVKSTQERIKSRLDKAKDQSSKLEDMVEKNTQSNKMRKDSKRTRIL